MKFKLLILLLVSLNITILFADTTYVSGTIAGETWKKSGSPYCAVGDLFIASLKIEPGVQILFKGFYEMEVGGVLTAIGTQKDTIFFSKCDNVSGWKGIYFNYSNPGSQLTYCKIEYSDSIGIVVNNSSPLIKNCLITNNSVSGYKASGGGIASNVSLIIEDCTISNNLVEVSGINSSGKGGGIYFEGNVSLINCIIKNNTINAQAPTNTGGGHTYARGGGIYSDGNLLLKKSEIDENKIYATSGSFVASHAFGGGIYCVDSSYINNSIIENNSASATNSFGTSGECYGGGLFVEELSEIRNSIISNNSLSDANKKHGSGIYISSNLLLFENSTIAYNKLEGIYNHNGSCIVRNCILWGNNSSQITGNADVTYSDIQDGYDGTGNIEFNPLFYSKDSLKIVAGSLCIDAGNPDSVYYDPEDPDKPNYALWPALGTIRNDMGAHGGPGAKDWLDTLVTGFESDRSFSVIKNYYLYQNFPNPFNPKTKIKFDLPKAILVKLEVFNMLGQRAAVLLDGRKPAGYHEVTFDGSNLASGVYYYRIQAGEFTQVKKMLLVK